MIPQGKVAVGKLSGPIAYGAEVIQVEGSFDEALALVVDITQKTPIALVNSINPYRIEGQKTVSIEILQQFDWEAPDVIIIPGGNLGNVSALGKGFLMMRDLGLIQKLPRIAVAQAENANPLYRSFLTHFEAFAPMQAQRTLASAIQIGNPVSYKRAIRVLQAFDGVVAQASEDELADPLIFSTFDNLGNGESFILVNDHDPKPLYYSFLHEREGLFSWDYLEQGPEL